MPSLDHSIVGARVIKGGQAAGGGREEASNVGPLSSKKAGGTIVRQIPHFLEFGVDLTSFHPATINVSVAPLLLKFERPTHSIAALKWHPDYAPENFSFFDCEIGFAGDQFSGFIYLPHRDQALGAIAGAQYVEVIARKIPALEYGSLLQLKVPNKQISVLM